MPQILSSNSYSKLVSSITSGQIGSVLEEFGGRGLIFVDLLEEERQIGVVATNNYTC